MSGIDQATTTNTTQASDAEAAMRLDLPFLPDGDVGHLVKQLIPVLRRPPALRFAKPIDLHNAVFDKVVGTHLARLRQRDASAFAFELTEMVVRLGPKIGDGSASRLAIAGFETVSETVLMYEHLYLAQAGAGGQ
ncbi:MAG: hypothetical protein AAFY14_11755 [Pseudomonadota bacterium]